MERTVGCRLIDLYDAQQQTAIPLACLYPAHAAEETVRFGPYAVQLAMEAEISATDLPLIVLSHGNGGSPWVYRDLARELAKAGFAVALPEHIGNSRSDNSLAGTIANLENRPRHVRIAIDAAFEDPGIGPALRPDVAAIVGHSFGGYTGLTVAGGKPWSAPGESSDGVSYPIAAVVDPRIRALALLAPATPWLAAPGALEGVRVPVLMMLGEKDEITPPWHGDIVKRGLPDATKLETRIVENAGHFSFMSPFPSPLDRPSFPPSQDPEGFDRAAYAPRLAAEIVVFLQKSIG